MIQTKLDIINKILLGPKRSPGDYDLWAFYVHASIMVKWKKFMLNLWPNNEWEMCDEIIQIGTKNYDMCKIVMSRITKKIYRLVYDAIIHSQFSFPWEDNPTLFISVRSFHVMERFIRNYKLETYILKMEEKLGITATDDIIKVVTFDESVYAKLNIIREYKNFFNRKLNYYFMTNAFPWQQSYLLQKININKDLYSIGPIFLRHLGTLNYSNELNIMDLLSFRLAINDVRDPFLSKLVISEIDFMIKRELTKLVNNRYLDLESYLFLKNSKPIGYLIYYLVYVFQNNFETLNINNYETYHEPYKYYESYEFCVNIRLAEESDVINIVKEKFNIGYKIDGSSFDNMNLNYFLELVDCRNVMEIILDANYRWHDNGPKLSRSLSDRNGHTICVHLKGENTYKFVEDFIAALKTVTVANSRIILKIYCSLNDYKIFDNLTVSELIFEYIKIDKNFLDDLYQCNLNTCIIKLLNVHIENICHNWEILNNLSSLKYATIQEDEGTWQSLFEFVRSKMLKSKSNKFKFSNLLYILYGLKKINLDTIKFTCDEQLSKLELRTNNNKIVDLYDLKFKVYPDKKSNYEFYQ